MKLSQMNMVSEHLLAFSFQDPFGLNSSMEDKQLFRGNFKAELQEKEGIKTLLKTTQAHLMVL